MADEVTNTVKNVSDGTVKITVEKYQELLAAAAVKAPVIYNHVQKTQAMVAADNKMWGAVMLGAGASLSVIGGFVYRLGKAQEKKL